MQIMSIIANALQVLAYFFNPKLREEREREKIWAIFHNYEERSAKALVVNDIELVEKLAHWMQEYRDKYKFIKGGQK